MNEIFKSYKKFVNGVTSETSLQSPKFVDRICEIEDQGMVNFVKMDTACSGIAGEAGEINDIWKKIKFHGKPWNEQNRQKMIDECGDMFWYLTHLMEVLNVEVEDVLKRNVEKLESRYPGGKFSIEASENRNDNSIPKRINLMENSEDVPEAVKKHFEQLGVPVDIKQNPNKNKSTTAEVGFEIARTTSKPSASISPSTRLIKEESSSQELSTKKRFTNIFKKIWPIK